MSYRARGTSDLGMMYATAGLGFDRLAEGSSRTFVISITAVRGLASPADAPLVPRRIVEYMAAEGLPNGSAGWAEGGRVWARYSFSSPAEPLPSNVSARRTKLRRALERAAASLGVNVRFDVAGGGTIPTVAAPPAPKEVPPPSEVTPEPPVPPDAEVETLATTPWAYVAGGAAALVGVGLLVAVLWRKR